MTNRAETMCAGLAMARRIWVDGFSVDTMQEHEGSGVGEKAQFQLKQHLSFCGFVTSFKVQVQS